MAKNKTRGPGRPTKWNPERQEEICGYLREGLPLETCAKLAGICRSTLLLWKSRGKEGEAPYSDFLSAVNQATADAERVLLADIRRASRERNQWQAAAWILERRHPAQYGYKREIRVEMDGAVGLTVSPVDRARALLDDAD